MINNYIWLVEACTVLFPSIYLGENLVTLDMAFNFDIGFCDPIKEYKKLVDAAEKHSPMPLIFGSGAHHGHYVIVGINSELKQTNKKGDVVSMQVNVSLKEFSELNLI